MRRILLAIGAAALLLAGLRMHGTNERLAVPNYERAIRFYRQLIRDAAGS